MMDESDEDFKELCASFFQRVKKNGTKEVFGEKKTQKASSSTQIRNKRKKTKQPRTKKTFEGTVEKPPSHSEATTAEQQGAVESQESEPALPVNGEEAVLAPAPDFPVLWQKAQSIRTDSAPGGDFQSAASPVTPAKPSPPRCRAAELAVQRMQQFKRADPERLRHAPKQSTLGPTLEEQGPESPRVEPTAGNGFGPGLPATDSDAAVALALQLELGREGAASTCDDGLEEKGLFFCQMCHKNLSAMTVTRREQHVNRCLDEAERIRKSCAPQIPECPICGKPFLTPKSRSTHLKQCAVKMEVGPQLLLQAVRLQAAQPRASSSPPAPSFHYTGGLKRKKATNKEPQKRQKVKPEPLSEDVLTAMALSRSEMEQSPDVPALRLESAFSEQMMLGTEKKSRKKRVLKSPPQLIVQDSETTGRQIEDRVAQLLAEEMELGSTPPLPASRILKEELEKAGWCLQLPEGKQNFLWEGSALTKAWAMESFYTAGLIPLLVPQQATKEPAMPLVLPEKSQPSVPRPPALQSSPAVGPGRDQPPSASQREHQALQDLVDLAEEALSASPLPSGSEDLPGLDLLPSQLPLTGFVLAPREKPLERSSLASHSRDLLISDFGTMVNNPHLSDVQFQMDSGDMLYAHKFVLYARCPLLIQYVNSEGFSAVEDGDQTQRVLLSNVRAEAVHAFLQYLYAADLDLPSHLAPDLHSLALRFGVSDLAYLCEQVPVVTECEAQEKEDENCESRAENFQELLRSVWGDEEEEAETLLKLEGHEEEREKVNEAEMEEIYEFAATQRKLLQEEKAADHDEDPGLPRKDSPGAGPSQPGIQENETLGKAEQIESDWPEKGETPARWENAERPFLLEDQCSDETCEQEAPREMPGHPHSCSGGPLAGCQAGSKGGSLSLPISVREYEQLLASTPDEFFELSQTARSCNEHSDSVGESEGETVCPPTPRQHQGHHLNQSQPHPPHTSNSSLSMTHSHQGISKMAPRSPSPVKPSKRKRDKSSLTLLKEPGHQKGKRRSSRLRGKNKSIEISPENSQPIDLTQSKSDHLSSRFQSPPSRVNKEDEVILLLDSDEELELEHSKTKSVSKGSPGRNVQEASLKSSELFSIIDVDADQESSPGPVRGEEGEVTVGGRGTPELFGDQESSAEEDPTTDASWLVPATPLANRHRDCSSQTQISSLRSRPPGAGEASAEHGAELQAAEFSTVVPGGSPVTCPFPRRHGRALLAPSPVSGGCSDFTRQYQKPCPPGLGQPSELAVSEVVEVGDSEEEEGGASYRANSSPLLDSHPPIPVGHCSWQVEPLSPIPIDHLNLERTGPLSTSSPRSRARGALDSGSCYSLGFLDTTPNRRGFTAQGELAERAPRASSPGSSRLSFLNPALWEDWDEEEEDSPAQSPNAQTQKPARPETPEGANRKNLPPKVPITPMPRYSIMETPVLKKELDRFGVRPLPKRQMVLKLKEIFQYTHQTVESESEGEMQPSQVPPEAPPSQTLTTETRGHAQGPKGPTKTKGPQHCVPQPSERDLLLSRPPPSSPGPDGDTQFLGSQESVATSVDSGDSSFSSQSSSCEFGAALESVGEGEEASASQAAVQTADLEEALRRHVRSTPALYQKVLLYQPVELAEVQAELKRDGLRVATTRLLDTLDSHCITFTTAAARKEKLRKRQKRN